MLIDFPINELGQSNRIIVTELSQDRAVGGYIIFLWSMGK